MKLLSVTSLASYLYCPRKLYIEQVLKIVKIPKEAMVKGTLRHSVHESINLAEKELVSEIIPGLSYQDVEEKYRQRYSQILRNSIIRHKSSLRAVNLDLAKTFKETWPIIINQAMQRAQNAFTFSKKSGLFGQELWDELTPKISSEVKLQSDKIGIKGIIDEVMHYDDEIVPVELKTGKAPQQGTWPGHKIQIAAYMLMAKESFDKPIKQGIVRYLDHDKESHIVFDPFLENEVFDIISKVNAILASSLPPILDNKNKCLSCQLKDDCFTLK